MMGQSLRPPAPPPQPQRRTRGHRTPWYRKPEFMALLAILGIVLTILGIVLSLPIIQHFIGLDYSTPGPTLTSPPPTATFTVVAPNISPSGLLIPCDGCSPRVTLNKIDFYQPDNRSMNWTFTLENTTEQVCKVSVVQLRLTYAQGRFEDGTISGVGDIAPGNEKRITASFPLPPKPDDYTLKLKIACQPYASRTYTPQNFTIGSK